MSNPDIEEVKARILRKLKGLEEEAKTIGISTPTRENVQRILDFIVEQTKDKEMIKWEDVVTKFGADAQQIIEMLIRQGTLYEPRAGWLRKT